MKLLYKLAKDNNLQLFIATHSASLLNAAAHEEAQIFQSKTTWIDSKPNVGALLDEMGYRASDILQSNCIIWVEGPSDRTYINFWIRGLRNDFVEGTHYTIMFYGGRLLSHLGALDASGTDDFIELTSLNRHNAIIMDSDRKSPQSKLNATKRRIQTAFTNDAAMTWITDGREIENYLDAEKLKAAIKIVHANAVDFTPAGQWSSMLKFKGIGKKLKIAKGAPQKLRHLSPIKVKIAREYTKNNAPDYSALDLKEQMDSLISFISRCN